MAKLKITTPVTDYSGFCGNLEFVDGVGYADQDTHAAEIAYCERNGYTVAPVDEPECEVEVDEKPPPPTGPVHPDSGVAAHDGPAAPAAPPAPADDKMPARNGSADAWRAYATAHGMDPDEAAELSRDQLVERFASKEDTPK